MLWVRNDSLKWGPEMWAMRYWRKRADLKRRPHFFFSSGNFQSPQVYIWPPVLENRSFWIILAFTDVTFGGQMIEWDQQEFGEHLIMHSSEALWQVISLQGAVRHNPSICALSTSLCVCHSHRFCVCHSHRFRKLSPLRRRLWSVSLCPPAPVPAVPNACSHGFKPQ